MKALLSRGLHDVDDLLRGDRTHPQMLINRGLDIHARRLAVIVVVLCMIYGLCMGTYSLLKDVPPGLNDRDGRYLQVLASTLKTPALFFLTLVVTLPSLYVFNALVGSRLPLVNLVKLLVASLAVNAAVLASLGPIVAFFSVSTNSHAFIVLLNVAAFAVAGVLGLTFLLQTLHRLSVVQPLLAPRKSAIETVAAGNEASSIEGSPDVAPSALDMPKGQVLADHTRTVFRCWVVLFAMVGAQMGWVLRPFIGRPELPFEWFRERQSNFFAAVVHALRELLFGPGGVN